MWFLSPFLSAHFIASSPLSEHLEKTRGTFYSRSSLKAVLTLYRIAFAPARRSYHNGAKLSFRSRK